MKKPIYKRTWFIVLVVIFTLGFIGSFMTNGSNDVTTINTADIPTEDSDIVEVSENVEALSDEQITSNVVDLINNLSADSTREEYLVAREAYDKLSWSQNFEVPTDVYRKLKGLEFVTCTLETAVDLATDRALGKKEKVEISNNEDATSTEGRIVTIYMAAGDNFTTEMIRDGILLSASQLLSALQARNDISQVNLNYSFTLVDAYGNGSSETVLKMSLTADTLKKINFDLFDEENFSVVADDYFEHVELSK